MKRVTWIERAASGDAPAFRELVTGHRAFVQALCVSHVADAAEAEDLTQEVFVQVHRDLSNLRDPEKFLPWLRQVTRNVCLMWLRRRHAARVPLETAAEQRDPRAENRLGRTELQAVLTRVLGQVSPKSREVLALRYLAGCSEAEIATALGVRPATVKSRLYEGRKQAKRTLQPAVKELLQLEDRSEEAVTRIMERCGSPSCVCPETLMEGR
jgi:RNA polymerase sigma-70 factor (ECF subfamily)